MMISSTALRGQTISVGILADVFFALLTNEIGLKATFCSCFAYGKLAHRIRDPTLSGYERINTDVRLIFLLIIRKTYQLPVHHLPYLRYWICVSSHRNPS
jgi:hypothetical protein